PRGAGGGAHRLSPASRLSGSALRSPQAADTHEPVRVSFHAAHEDGDLRMGAGRAIDRVCTAEATDRRREHEHDDEEPAPIGARDPLTRLPHDAATISDAIGVLP